MCHLFLHLTCKQSPCKSELKEYRQAQKQPENWVVDTQTVSRGQQMTRDETIEGQRHQNRINKKEKSNGCHTCDSMGGSWIEVHQMLWCDLCSNFKKSQTDSHWEHHNWMGMRLTVSFQVKLKRPEHCFLVMATKFKLSNTTLASTFVALHSM